MSVPGWQWTNAGGRVSRIVRIAIAVVALGAAGWAIVHWLMGPSDQGNRNALLARGTDILRQDKSNSAIVPLENLFGSDIDGVCIVWNGPVDETSMRQASPAKFGSAIRAITNLQAGDSTLDSDTRYWVAHAVKGGAVLRSYSMSVRSAVDLYRTDVQGDPNSRAPEGRCFDRTMPAQLNLYAEQAGEGKTLIIKVPAEPPAGNP